MLEAEGDEDDMEEIEPMHGRSSYEPNLQIEEEHPGCVVIFFAESADETPSFATERKAPTRRVLLCRADATKSLLTIYPIVTLNYKSDYLEQKYMAIESISISGWKFDLPESAQAAADLFLGLPRGFVKDYRFGLGLKKEYKAIIEAIEEDTNIHHVLVDCRNPGVKIDNDVFIMGHNEFDALRRAFDRTSAAYRREARADRQLLAYNSLLSAADEKRYTPRTRTYKKDTIYKIVSSGGSTAENLSDSDQNAVLSLARKNKSTLMRSKPRELLQLRDEIEIVALEELIRLMTEMLGKQLNENAWQSFFKKNPFVLSLAFGYPVILIADQVSVGGTKFSGAGGKIADFLIKNRGTDNAALIEIKTPTTLLLRGTSYRGGVHAPSYELAGAINQCLDQRFMFQKNIVSLKDNSEISALETYGVKCVLIVGTTPTEKVLRKSFELVRHSLKDVDVVTFDELLAKLKLISNFISPKTPEGVVVIESDNIPF